MKRIRIGKDFALQWSIYSNGEPYALDSENIILRLVTPLGKEQVGGFTIEDNTLTWTFRGRDQKLLGVYALELVERDGVSGMLTIDTCKAFELVAHTCQESDNEGGNVEIAMLSFESEVTFGSAKVEVDDQMSALSYNPVQNKVVKAYVDDVAATKQDTISDINSIRSGAVKGATALQSVPSEYVTESKLASKSYATTAQLINKQDVISDLDSIRAGAVKGATALQSVPSEYVTESKLANKGYATTAQLLAKQDVISDLDSIRANSAKAATALQSVPSEYVTESQLAGKGYATQEELTANYNSLNNMITNIEQSIIGALNTEV